MTSTSRVRALRHAAVARATASLAVFFVVAVIAVGLARGRARAQDAVAAPTASEPAPSAPAEAQDAPRLHGSATLDWTSAYYFRGIVQEREGLILQPALALGLDVLTQPDSTLSAVRISTGIWTSFHTGPSGHTDQPGAPSAWYEADLFATAAVELAGAVTVDLTYTAYLSPNASFARVHELSLGAAYADASLYEGVLGGRFHGLAPAVRIARELDGTAFGTSEGTFASVAIAPEVSLLDAPALALGVALPVELGLGLGDYYETDTEDDAFGYLRAAASLRVGLAFVPPAYGSWSLSLGPALLVLGDNTRDLAGRRVEVMAGAQLAIGS